MTTITLEDGKVIELPNDITYDVLINSGIFDDEYIAKVKAKIIELVNAYIDPLPTTPDNLINI